MLLQLDLLKLFPFSFGLFALNDAMKPVTTVVTATWNVEEFLYRIGVSPVARLPACEDMVLWHDEKRSCE